MNVRKSAEDYLEAMLMLQEKQGFVRSVDVAAHLGVTKPSVSYATKRLRENGYITMDHEGLISLTAQGMEIADSTYARHRVLARFLVALGVDVETALQDACKIEHDLSEASFRAIRAHIENM